MKLDQRRFEILALIERNGTVRIHELASHFSVTEMTLRRDLNRLSDLGFIKRFHGGAEASSSENLLFNITLDGREVKFKEEKKNIGRLASKHIKEGQLIFIHGGTTTFELARNLPKNFSFQVVTNSGPLLGVLCEYDNIDVISTGGVLKHISGTFYGPHAELLIEKLNIDVLFMGASGVSIEKGLTEFDFNVASLKTKIIEKSKQRILLFDSHKFNIVRSIAFGRLKDFHIVITDDNIDPHTYNSLINMGIKVIT